MQAAPVRILVLEDDDDLRFVLSQLLEAEGYQVETASRGEEAVEKAARSVFDLVVADIRMEGLDGLDAVAHLREHQPGMRALVVTGYSTEADSIRAIRLGVGDYLKKPFDLDEFLQSVSRLVADRRQEQARRQRELQLLDNLKMALEMVARSLGKLAPVETAKRLSRKLGLGEEACRHVELAALLMATSGLQPFDESQLPAGVAGVLRHASEHWDGTGGPDGLAGEQIPIESRVVAVAMLGEEFDRNLYDPQVLAALEADESAGGSPETAAQQRGLLSLGRTLEASGRFPDAERAYQLAKQGSGREHAEALLGLARIARRSQEHAVAEAFAREAVQVAQPVGPQASAATLLEAGILLGGDADYLRQAGRLYQGLRVPSGEARALLALRVLSGAEVPASQVEAALALLLQPEQASELALSCSWLMPFVLGQAGRGNAVFDRAAARMAREFQRELCRQLTAGTLDVSARVAAATALGGAADSAAGKLLASDPDPAVRGALRPGNAAGPSLPLLRIHSFGPLEVFRGEEPVDEASWRGQKNKYLFAFLASQGGKPVMEDVLIDHFWPDDAEKGRRNLYWANSVLRRCLRPASAPESADYIPRSNGALRLNPELPRWHDLEEFQQRAAEQTVEAHRRLVTLYRGPYLEGCYMDWVLPIRTWAEERVSQALSALMEAAQQAEKHAEVLEHSQRLLELDPCRQEAAVAAMMALLSLGRPEEAVRRYEACRKSLRRELDLEPGIPLFEAYQRAKLCL